MKTTKSFNTSSAISHWRSILYNTRNFNDEQIDELECHLRDQIDVLKSLDISDEEKFLLALHRIGSEEILSRAYGRRSIFNFSRFSLVAQAVLFMLVLLQLSRLGNFLTTHFAASFIPSNQLIFAFFFGTQFMAVLLVFVLYRLVLKVSKREHQMTKANFMAMGIFTTSTLITVLYPYFTRVGYIFNGPVIVGIVPNMVFVIGFIFLIVATIREWKRNRIRVKMA